MKKRIVIEFEYDPITDQVCDAFGVGLEASFELAKKLTRGNRYVNWYCADHEKEAKE
jgi:hypothetical protein